MFGTHNSFASTLGLSSWKAIISGWGLFLQDENAYAQIGNFREMLGTLLKSPSREAEL